ncbi:DUF3429 domain-containing protein [Gilvimarinus sp. DA14]|uniref:DUF3429 domain-containing protein n=1 Tax=Gilvimarinus sp. DA14 TaxID=2956798 RepID=UPI0020B6C40A|nr:DUF3429 domain-containing protein [Gilvimarinus sp. DA14]UTF59610.1 DUF3429 domain-containing protein [Gilvimarinus sp. DA14]
MNQTLRNLLGYAGLIPFIGLALACALPDYRHTAVLGLISYGAIILSFMAGSLWGQVQSETGSRAGALIASNALALSGWAALYYAVTGWPLLALAGLTLGFIACWACERVWVRQEAGYQWLRTRLTFIVVACLASVIAVFVTA